MYPKIYYNYHWQVTVYLKSVSLFLTRDCLGNTWWLLLDFLNCIIPILILGPFNTLDHPIYLGNLITFPWNIALLLYLCPSTVAMVLLLLLRLVLSWNLFPMSSLVALSIIMSLSCQGPSVSAHCLQDDSKPLKIVHKVPVCFFSSWLTIPHFPCYTLRVPTLWAFCTMTTERAAWPC